MKRAIMRIVKAGLLTLLVGHAIPSFGQAGVTAPGNFAGALMGTSVPTYVAGQEYLNATAGTSFTSSPFDSTGADLLVMFLGCHNQTVFTITDSFGNTWLPLAGPAYKVGSAFFPMEGELFYAPNATTGTGHTITVGLSQAEPLIMSIAALSGDNIYSPIDAYSFITGDNGTLSKYIASSPLTTFQPNDLLVGMIKGFDPNTYTAGTGYTVQSASAGTNFSAETRTASSAGSYTSSFTASNSDFWQTVVAAIAPKPTEAALSWTASTGGTIANYYIERCPGLGCSNFSQIASVSGSTLTYTDATISSGTVYNYRVRAQNSGGTYSPYSTVQVLSPIIPHVVSSLTATPARTLAWDASAESGGSISEYSIERCTGISCSDFSQIATTPSTSYTDTSAVAGTTYNYRVRAQDANNFYGPYSVVATASIPAYFDNSADGGNNGGSTTSLTYSYTVGTNSNRLLLVNLIGDLSADDISSVTYAGAPMTLLDKVQTPGDRWHYLYYLLAPTSGENNVVVTAASSHYLISEAASWYNVAQSGQPVAFTTNTASAASANIVSLTTSLPASANQAIVAESMWSYTGLIPNRGSAPLVVDSFFEGLGMFSSVPSPVTQAFPVSMTNTWGGQGSASSIMASFSLASNGTAGITYDNSADGGNNGGSTSSLTYSYTVGSGPNRLLVVNLIGDTSADDISSVTYAGTPMTLVGKVQSPSNDRQYLYYLLNPSSGSNSVVVTAGSAHYLISEAASWYNVGQSAQPDASTTNTAATASTSITTSLTTVASGSLVVQGMWSYGHLAAGAGATPILTDTQFGGAGIFVSSGSPVSPAGNVSMTTISDGAASTGVIMASFAPVSGPVPTVSSVAPSSGSTAGGTAVTITGTNFAAGATVTFGGTAATSVVVVSSTSITATTPEGSAGAVTVTVTNPGGGSGNLAGAFTYIAPPTVSSVTPNNGLAAGGTAVTITGTNFAAGATVTFGSTAATSVVVVSSTSITATTPAGSAGAVAVTVTNSNGLSGSLATAFTYIASPTVSSVAPSSGSTAGGTAVTITGTNFAARATVTFGATAATNVVVVSSTSITATTPAGSAGAVTVTVTNSNGLSGSLATAFTYIASPTVSSVAPSSGSTAGGTAVTITGTNFAAGATVTFGATAATNVVMVSSTSITATTPAGSAGAVTVTVTNSNGLSGSLASAFIYIAPPTVSSVAPSSGSTAGGTAVTITGTNFATGATVTFGGTAATNVVVASSTSITATTPARAAGAVTVTVTVNGQSGNLTNGFTFNPAVAIGFGQVAAATPQSATATVPVTYPAAQTAGDLNIVVVGWNDTTATVQSVKDSAGNNYSLAIGPTSGTGLRQSIYYAASIVGGSNTVTVTFSQAASFPDVRILEYKGVTTLDVTAGASGSSASANSGAATTTVASELIFGADTVATLTKAAGSGFTSRIITSPNGDIAEDKVVTTAGSNSAAATLSASGPWVMQMVTFSAVSGPTPTVASVSPNTGSTAGGTAVTITGTNFAAGATVTFGSAAATSVVVVSSTSITATTPAGSAGAATVTVTNPGGGSGNLASAFTYIAPPTVSSVTPNNGLAAGGTAVTITGTNFAAGATVTFGGTAATNVVVSSTSITATTPAGSAGAVTVTVTNSNELSGSLASAFTYVVPPTVSSVSPNTGSTAGGTAVTITGTNFATGATVTFGGTAATNVVVVSSTSITATTPAGSAGAVTVTVTNLGAQSGSLTNGFTYVVVPTVSSVSPKNGPAAGGTAVTITGTNFATGATVTFGGTAATNVVVASSTSITATTPAGSAGAVTVTVTNSNGLSGSLASAFTYIAPPTVSSVAPSSGSTAGGTAVTIAGTNFATGATVTFGSAAATSVVVVSSTSITATTPAGSAGAVTVTVTNLGAQSGSLTNGFTYVVVPTVSSVSPKNGPAAGGTAVTITGTNFATGATVTFGGTAATNVVVASSTSITATTPAHAAGAVTVTVTVNGQSGNLTNGFTFNPAVAIGFGQVAATTPQSATATVPVTYPAAQTAGDLNIVVVGWNDTTATVQSVKDSAGNNYSLAIGPTSGTGLRQSIYYAASIVGGSNTVTVTFSQAASFPDVRILEYKGVTTLDVTAGASGSSASANSGAATTTVASELIFGADTVATLTKAAGSGFTSRIITSPNGDIAEDKVVTTAGSNSAAATLSASGPWVMQMVTFK